MPDIPKGMVPARYIGTRFLTLGDGVAFYNIDGTRKKHRSLEYGDTLLLRDEDVYGKTLWHDPKGELPSEHIGLGHVVKKVDEGLSKEEAIVAGYEFHLKRADMEPLEPLEPSISDETLSLSFSVPDNATVEDSGDVKQGESEAE
jgi:hypothetical protein